MSGILRSAMEKKIIADTGKKKNLLPPAAAKDFFGGLCKESFAACGGERFFGWRHLFHDFASQNREKDVSIQR